MSRYHRASVSGAAYFFTVVTYRRQRILCDDLVRHALRDAMNESKRKHRESMLWQRRF